MATMSFRKHIDNKKAIWRTHGNCEGHEFEYAWHLMDKMQEYIIMENK
jgi:hypothetical protein